MIFILATAEEDSPSEEEDQPAPRRRKQIKSGIDWTLLGHRYQYLLISTSRHGKGGCHSTRAPGGDLYYLWLLCLLLGPSPHPLHWQPLLIKGSSWDIAHLITMERGHKGMIGPFNHPPFTPWCQVNLLLTRPKKDSTRRTVIMDHLSWPPPLESSVNRGHAKGHVPQCADENEAPLCPRSTLSHPPSRHGCLSVQLQCGQCLPPAPPRSSRLAPCVLQGGGTVLYAY